MNLYGVPGCFVCVYQTWVLLGRAPRMDKIRNKCHTELPTYMGCYFSCVAVGVSVGGGGEVSVGEGISVGVSVDVGVSVGDGEAVGVREGGMNAVGVTVGVKVTVGVRLGTAVRVSAGMAVAETGMDVGVGVPSILPGARRIAIHPAQ